MASSTPSSKDAAKNRDDQHKPGAPPRPATEPAQGHGSSDTTKTSTDPATGAPHGAPPDPA